MQSAILCDHKLKEPSIEGCEFFLHVDYAKINQTDFLGEIMHWITMVGAFFTILCGVIGFKDGIVKKGKFKTTCFYLTFFFAAFTFSFIYNSCSF